MENKALVAVDLSENSLKAVDYLAEVMSCHPKACVTLLHVIMEPSPDIVIDEEQRKQRVEQLRTEALQLMEKAGERLTSRGISEERIRLLIQVCSKPVSVAELILHEQKDGGYDTIVMGKRGMSKREQFLFGSVSSRVVREARNCAVWIVD